MSAERKQITIWLTPEQYNTLNEYLGRDNRSDFVRELIGKEFERQGQEWPDDMPKRGKYERTPGD